MAKHGKRYLEASKQIDHEKRYTPQEAVDLTKRVAAAKFDETVELHLTTGSDPRQADQMVRGVAVLPHGTGKEVRILVFAQGEATRIAQEAGVKKLVLVHVGPNLAHHGTMEKGIGDIKKLYDGELVFSDELLVVDV